MLDGRSAAIFVNEINRHAPFEEATNGVWKYSNRAHRRNTKQPMGGRQVVSLLHNLAGALHV